MYIVERLTCVDLSKFLVTGELVDTAVSVNRNIPLNRPSGLCATEGGGVLLCNTGCNSILAFNLNLKFIQSFGADRLASPSDVKVNNNKIFVLNQSTSSISAFSTDFSFISNIPFQQLVVPNAFFFAINNRCNFVVSDKEASCLQVLSPSGEHLDTLGRGHLTEPQGVDIDASNRIVCVSQTRHNYFQIY